MTDGRRRYVAGSGERGLSSGPLAFLARKLARSSWWSLQCRPTWVARNSPRRVRRRMVVTSIRRSAATSWGVRDVGRSTQFPAFPALPYQVGALRSMRAISYLAGATWRCYPGTSTSAMGRMPAMATAEAQAELVSQVIEPVAHPVLEAGMQVLEVLRLTRPSPIYQAAFDVVRVALR